MKNYIYSLIMGTLVIFTAKGQSSQIINLETNRRYDFNNGTGIYLYPNPSQNIAHVILPDIALGRVRLFILDFNGRVLQSQIYSPGGNQLEFDVTNLPRGIYSLQIQEEGMPVQSIKLVKNEN